MYFAYVIHENDEKITELSVNRLLYTFIEYIFTFVTLPSSSMFLSVLTNWNHHGFEENIVIKQNVNRYNIWANKHKYIKCSLDIAMRY